MSNQLYFVINLTDSHSDYYVFASIELAEEYIQCYIQNSISQYDENSKYKIKKHLINLLKCTAPILVLKSSIDLPFFIQNKIPWKYIKKNYKLTDRFLEEFREYLIQKNWIIFVENITDKNIDDHKLDYK